MFDRQHVLVIGSDQNLMNKIIKSDFKIEFSGEINSGKKITKEELKKSIEFIGYKSTEGNTETMENMHELVKNKSKKKKL